MAIGKRLVEIRKLLKAELGDVLTPGVNSSNDAGYNLLLANKQEFFYQSFDWPHLRVKIDVALSAGTRYYDFPLDQLEMTKAWTADVLFGNRWMPVEKGIEEVNFNTFNSDLNMKADFVRRVDLYNQGAVQQLEVWPIPATGQTLRLTGIRPLNVLQSDDDTADLDHLVLVLFCAAEILSLRKQSNAQAKLSQATQILNRVRGAAPARDSVLIMGGAESDNVRNTNLSGRPTIAITP